MTSSNETPSALAAKIALAETRLDRLDEKISEIGQPAGHELRRRLEALRIEENALKRNFEESMARGEPDSVRMEKIETLLHHIEAEESSVEEDSRFLDQAAPSSVTIAAETGAKLVDAISRGVKKVVGDHHPFGSSVFVNHDHDTLVSRYGLDEEKADQGKSAE